MSKKYEDTKNKTNVKPKTEEKDKSKKGKKEDNFPGPGAYQIMGEMNKKESDKVQDKGKKDEKKGDKFVEQSTYLSENLCLTSLSPGPGGYNPNDQAVWNRIARDNNEKKGQPQTKGKAEGDKKNQGDKKKLEKP